MPIHPNQYFLQNSYLLRIEMLKKELTNARRLGGFRLVYAVNIGLRVFDKNGLGLID